MRAAKFYEVTDQIVLTGHLVDAVFVAVSGEIWEGLTADQQSALREAARTAALWNNEKRSADEAELVAFLEGEGLKVYEPDVAAFREKVQADYLGSEFSESWLEGLLERVNDTQ